MQIVLSILTPMFSQHWT